MARMVDADKVIERLEELIASLKGVYSAFSEHEAGYYDGKEAAYEELLYEIEEMLATDKNE